MRTFPSTLKETSVRWFMVLDGHGIQTCETMKDHFTKKHGEYWKSRDSRDEMLEMNQYE